MGAQLGSGGGPQADINVTPLVDIVLVLLIIFMVITPLLAKNIPIEVPAKAEIEEPPEEIKDQVVLKAFVDNHIEVNKTVVTIEELPEVLKTTYEDRPEKVMFFEAEDDVPYGNAVVLMDMAKGAGVTTLGIMTPDPDAPAATAGEGTAVPAGGEAPASP